MASLLEAVGIVKHDVMPVRPGLNGTSIVDARTQQEVTSVGALGLRRTVVVDTHWDGRTRTSSFWSVGGRRFGVTAGDYKRAA